MFTAWIRPGQSFPRLHSGGTHHRPVLASQVSLFTCNMKNSDATAAAATERNVIDLIVVSGRSSPS